MNFRHYVYAAIRRSEPEPQDLGGIIWHVAQEIGVYSQADRDKLPTDVELSESLKQLIEAGKIVEVSPQRYREATYGSDARNFSGVSPHEFRKECAAYFEGLNWIRTKGWNIDVAGWPGPDRTRWRIGDDVVSPSPDGRHACVLYSCAEIRLGWTVGLLALRKGPPDRPTVILRPRNFTCYVDDGNCVQWLDGGRYCAVVPYLFNSANNRIELLTFTFLDVADETFTHHEMTDILYFVGRKIVEQEGHWVMHAETPRGQADEVRIDPKRLEWQPWRNLTGTSECPPPDSSEFIEVPY
jgi:hypothetical protein